MCLKQTRARDRDSGHSRRQNRPWVEGRGGLAAPAKREHSGAGDGGGSVRAGIKDGVRNPLDQITERREVVAAGQERSVSWASVYGEGRARVYLVAHLSE